MAFTDWAPAKTDVGRVATDGERSLHFPAYSPSLTKVKVLEGACSGCTKEVTHNICKMLGVNVPHGESRYERLPAANKLAVSDVNKIQSALAVLAHAGHGQIGNDVDYNVSGGGNASQTWTYEITAASGNTLTIKGDNPKRLSSGGQTFAMAVGWTVEYASPSALSGKNNPMITKIYPPASTDLEDVTFDIDVSIGCGSAMEPIDANDPPGDGKYYCTIRGEATTTAKWWHFTAPVETAFTNRQAVEFTTDAVHNLLDTGGNATRVLWPGMIANAVVIQLFNGATAGPYVNPLEEYMGAPRLVTTDSGPTSWATTLDLRGLGIGTTYTKAVVSFCPEARSADTWRVQFAGACAHSYAEASGSYAHASGYRCAAVESTGFADYQGAQCWKPGSCSHFALGDRVESYGTSFFLPDDGADPSFWSGLWHRADWLLRQVTPNVSTPPATAFVLERKSGGGPSVNSLVGGFVNSVPTMSGVASIEPYHSPVFGRRVTWTDGDGNQHQQIVTGAFVARGLDFSGDDGPDLTSDASTAPELGAFPTEATGWQTKTDPLGSSLSAGLATLPYRLTGGLQPYQYNHGGPSFAKANERWTAADMAITSVDLTEDGDATLATFVRARFL